MIGTNQSKFKQMGDGYIWVIEYIEIWLNWKKDGEKERKNDQKGRKKRWKSNVDIYSPVREVQTERN